MRTEWILGSAAMLVLSGIALTVGFGILPLPQDEGMEAALLAASRSPERWLASCALIFAASISLTLGSLAVMSLLRRDRRFALMAVGLFVSGAVGMCGYATVLAFIRGLILNDQLAPSALEEIVRDPGTMAFALAWQVCFLLSLCLIAAGLFRNSGTPRWVPVLLLVFVVSQFVIVPGEWYYETTLMKWIALAVAFGRMARAAAEYAHHRDVEQVLTGGIPHTV